MCSASGASLHTWAVEQTKATGSVATHSHFNPGGKGVYTLQVEAGTYTESSLARLAWLVFVHRLHHFFKGEGFKD